jgi:hypothetical protein
VATAERAISPRRAHRALTLLIGEIERLRSSDLGCLLIHSFDGAKEFAALPDGHPPSAERRPVLSIVMAVLSPDGPARPMCSARRSRYGERSRQSAPGPEPIGYLPSETDLGPRGVCAVVESLDSALAQIDPIDLVRLIGGVVFAAFMLAALVSIAVSAVRNRRRSTEQRPQSSEYHRPWLRYHPNGGTSMSASTATDVAFGVRGIIQRCAV